MFRRIIGQMSALALAVFLPALPVLAGLGTGAGSPSNLASKFSTLEGAIRTIFGFVILLAAVVFVILFLVGGVQYLTAAGNEEATGKAKRLLVDAIVGLVIVLAAWAVGNFVLSQLIGPVTLEGTTTPGAGGGGGTPAPPS